MTDGVVARALAEDVGDGDVTSAVTVRSDGAGARDDLPESPRRDLRTRRGDRHFRALDAEVVVERLVQEGWWREDGPVVALEGSARGDPDGERTALNFLLRLSGVATMAARSVPAESGTGATILDTRKTTPGLRALEKAAVAAGAQPTTASACTTRS